MGTLLSIARRTVSFKEMNRGETWEKWGRLGGRDGVLTVDDAAAGARHRRGR